MDNLFSNLKNSMKKTVFKDFSFSNERKVAVKEAIRAKQSPNHLHSWKEETLYLLFELLQYEGKLGYDLSIQLIQHNDLTFQNNEGQLYSLLHLIEKKGFITSEWKGEKKYYSLTSKGQKCLASYKQTSPKQKFSLKHLLEEASL
ncbi:hypothetical protein BC6307_08475 [Sutcliffiella cohnii]|uniref:Transcription regulator PadR N-terminal domain-containing protein n=1 Tax=Sutcliffiella cohnii TaxID=33932 RepID=A0A223KPC6_9BACI|nr:PadR family transcriptional regulator [Sutcliffiella cohnii]AST91309.1 hypothetical protein BC6307_08475 [Sutcliffiella cohnii]